MKIQTAAVAYRCPICGYDVMGEVDLFDLGGEGAALTCECGGSTLTLRLTSDSKIHISVPCLFCPEDHTFRLSGVSFLERDLFTLSCKYTGVEIAFMGDHAKVLEGLQKSAEKLAELLGQFAEDEEEAEESEHCEHEECGEHCHCEEHAHSHDQTSEIPQPTGDLIGACANPAVAMNILYLIKDFAEEEKIRCACGSKNYNLQIGFDHIRLTCPRCGGEYRISTLSENDQFSLADRADICIGGSKE